MGATSAGASAQCPLGLIDAPNPSAIDGFGRNVAISGNVAAVAAPWDNTSGFEAGAIHLLDVSDVTAPTMLSTIYPPPDSFLWRFGDSMTIDGELLLVGVPRSDPSAEDGGSMRLYDISDPTRPELLAQMVPPGLGSLHLFGRSVAIHGSWAVGLSTPALGASIAHLYDITVPTDPVLRYSIEPPDPDESFGFGVAVDDDRLIVGGTNARVFDISDPSMPLEVGRLLVGPSGGDFGGASNITIAEDVAYIRRSSSSAAGAVFVYDLTVPGVQSEVAVLSGADDLSLVHFGDVIVATPDHLVVGHSWNSRVYLYDRTDPLAPEPIGIWSAPGPPPSEFGVGLAADGATLMVGDKINSFVPGGRAWAIDLFAGPLTDCNGNGLEDRCEITVEVARDCDGNTLIDDCEIAVQPELDCNVDGALDACAAALGLQPGQYVDFPAEDARLVGNATPDFPTDAFTLQMWVRGTLGESNVIEGIWSYAAETDEGLEANEITILGRAIYIRGEQSPQGTFDVEFDDQWHHITLTWHSETGETIYYADGEVAMQTTLAAGEMLTPGGVVVLGDEQDSLGGGFDPNQSYIGHVDDIRLYRTVRSVEQIIADRVTPVDLSDPTLVAHWSLDEVGPVFSDHTGTSLLTASGGAVAVPQGDVDCDGNGVLDACELDAGDLDSDGVLDVCQAACPDLDGDGTVGFGDVVGVLASWGPCPAPCVPDLDGDGSVGFTDLLAVLGAWGACPG